MDVEVVFNANDRGFILRTSKFEPRILNVSLFMPGEFGFDWASSKHEIGGLGIGDMPDLSNAYYAKSEEERRKLLGELGDLLPANKRRHVVEYWGNYLDKELTSMEVYWAYADGVADIEFSVLQTKRALEYRLQELFTNFQKNLKVSQMEAVYPRFADGVASLTSRDDL